VLQNAVIIDCNNRKINRRVWRMDEYRHYLPPDLCSIQEILRADLVSIQCHVIK